MNRWTLYNAYKISRTYIHTNIAHIHYICVCNQKTIEKKSHEFEEFLRGAGAGNGEWDVTLV